MPMTLCIHKIMTDFPIYSRAMRTHSNPPWWPGGGGGKNIQYKSSKSLRGSLVFNRRIPRVQVAWRRVILLLLEVLLVVDLSGATVDPYNRVAICVSGQLRGAGSRMEELMDMRRAVSSTNLGAARVFASIHIKDFGKGLANGTGSLRESLREHTRVAAVVLALDPASYEVCFIPCLCERTRERERARARPAPHHHHHHHHHHRDIITAPGASCLLSLLADL